MLTLYYSPGACSLAPHIALCENNIEFKLLRVDLTTKKLDDGSDYMAINYKGYVPTLQLDNGEILTECAAALFYIAELNPNSQKISTPASFERYRLQEALTFVSSEMHKTGALFFDPTLPADYRERVIKKLKRRLHDLEAKLNTTEYLAGNEFSVADAYCFAIIRWVPALNIGLSLERWPKVEAYYKKILARPKVQEVMKQEGLIE